MWPPAVLEKKTRSPGVGLEVGVPFWAWMAAVLGPSLSFPKPKLYIQRENPEQSTPTVLSAGQGWMEPEYPLQVPYEGPGCQTQQNEIR